MANNCASGACSMWTSRCPASWRSCSVRGGGLRTRLRLADLRARRPDAARGGGAQVPRIELGTGVVPVYPRHPMMLAQQALTVQAATDNRLILGIGLSHQVVVEGMWGMSFDKPLVHEGVPRLAHADAAGRDGVQRRGSG